MHSVTAEPPPALEVLLAASLAAWVALVDDSRVSSVPQALAAIAIATASTREWKFCWRFDTTPP